MVTRRIGLLAGDFPARTETFVARHATGLAARGWQVQVSAARVGEGIATAERHAIADAGVDCAYWGDWAPTSLGRALQFAGETLRDPSVLASMTRKTGWTRPEVFLGHRLRRHLSSLDTGGLHIHFGKYAGLLAETDWSRPVVVTWHGFDANMVPLLRGKDVYRRLFQRNWHHTVGSSFMRERLIEIGASADMIAQIPMGVSFDQFREHDRAQRATTGLKILSVGRLAPEKGHDVLLEAFARLRAGGVEATLGIIGEGPARAALEAQIRELELTAHVTLLGAHPETRVVEEMRAADVFALTGRVGETGRVETQGVSIIEAQATGLPVVVTDVGGAGESLMPGKTGVLTGAGDVTAITNAFARYAAEPALRHAQGRAGAAFVQSKFGLNTMLDAFEQLYSEVVS